MTDTIDASQTSLSEDGREPEKRKRRAGVAWWWLLVFLAIAALVYGPIWYAEKYGKKPEPAPAPAPQAEAPAPAPQPPVKTQCGKQKVENAFFYRIDGKDKQGHAAAFFDFIILTNDYTWVIGSTSEVVSNGGAIPEEAVADRVLTQQVRDSQAPAT